MSAKLATRSDAAEAMNNDTLHELLADIYEDRVVIRLIQFSVIWAVVAMTAGVYLSAELLWPTIDFWQFWLSFGRLRPLHTNDIIFGFGVSALMATGFFSVQRTSRLKVWRLSGQN